MYDVPYACSRTLVAVYEGIFDNYCSAICGGELLCLAPRFPEATRVPEVAVGPRAAWDAQNMAGEEVFGTAEVGIRRVRFLVARGQEGLSRRDQKDLGAGMLATEDVWDMLHWGAYVVLRWLALAG